MASSAARTFFVETYVARLDRATAVVMTTRLRAAVTELRREGHALRWLRSFALVSEDTYIWMIAAPDVDHVAVVMQRAGVAHDHVVEAVPADPARSPAPRASH
jgi:hypothetical protein